MGERKRGETWFLNIKNIFTDNVDRLSNKGRHLTMDVKTGKSNEEEQKQVGSNQTRLETKKLMNRKNKNGHATLGTRGNTRHRTDTDMLVSILEIVTVFRMKPSYLKT